jgi:hypothetical protein
MRVVRSDSAASGSDETISLAWFLDDSKRETHWSNGWSRRRRLKVVRSIIEERSSQPNPNYRSTHRALSQKSGDPDLSYRYSKPVPIHRGLKAQTGPRKLLQDTQAACPLVNWAGRPIHSNVSSLPDIKPCPTTGFPTVCRYLQNDPGARPSCPLETGTDCRRGGYHHLCQGSPAHVRS